MYNEEMRVSRHLQSMNKSSQLIYQFAEIYFGRFYFRHNEYWVYFVCNTCLKNKILSDFTLWIFILFYF